MVGNTSACLAKLKAVSKIRDSVEWRPVFGQRLAIWRIYKFFSKLATASRNSGRSQSAKGEPVADIPTVGSANNCQGLCTVT